MFVSPVVYDIHRLQHVLTSRWVWLYEANPIATCIGLLRWAMIGTPMPTAAGMGCALVITVVVCVSGLAWFQRADQQLADRI
jgi:ABC-type polysaccharide/polyol phosphate export permease